MRSQENGEGLQTAVPVSVTPPQLATPGPTHAVFQPSQSVAHASAAAPAVKPMTPAERLAQLRTRVETERRDGEAWLALVEATQNQEDLEATKKVYEELLDLFPYAVSRCPARVPQRFQAKHLLPKGQAMDRLHRLPPCSVGLQRCRSSLCAMPSIKCQRGALALLSLVHTSNQPSSCSAA